MTISTKDGLKNIKQSNKPNSASIWEEEIEWDEVDWREDNKNRDYVLKKNSLIESINREKLITKKIAEELKDDFLKLIASGQLQFRYESEILNSQNLAIIKSWLMGLKAAFSKQKVGADIFVKLGANEQNNLSLQIVWEIPFAKIQNRLIVWRILDDFCKYIKNSKQQNLIVTVIFNKRDYQNSDLIGIYFSQNTPQINDVNKKDEKNI